MKHKSTMCKRTHALKSIMSGVIPEVYHGSPSRTVFSRLSGDEDLHKKMVPESSTKNKKEKLRLKSPQILINEAVDDVFFSNSISNKENLHPLNQTPLYLSPHGGHHRAHSRILSSSEFSPKRLPSVSSPGRVKLHSVGIDFLGNNISILGKGSFGTVILGMLNGKRVAVKIISRRDSESIVSPMNSKDGEVNAELLNHDNIVHVLGVFYDVVDSADNILILMEYVGKTNLQKLIHENKSIFSSNFIHTCLRDLSGALSYCHFKGVWHLDVKPSNVFVTSKGICKLGDFGCSRLSRTSSKNLLVGTPGYQAPEMLRHHSASDKCDVYSFGILCWQVIRRESPYEGLHPHAILYRVVSENLRPFDEVSLLPIYKPYQVIYKRSWDPNPRRRPDMKNIHSELVALRKDSSSKKIRI